MKYTISKKEMSRRIKAFSTLSASLTAGVILASFVLQFPVSVIAYFCIVFVFVLIVALLFKLFDSLSRVTVILSDKRLERINGGKSENYIIADIKEIRIKRTKSNIIREIHISFLDGKGIFISALEEFEDFISELTSRLGKDVVIKKIREPIDFDHPLFYSILGFPISFACIFLFKIIARADFFKMKSIIFVFSIYLFAAGIYFPFKKPISERYGKKSYPVDYIVGLFMVCCGICCLLAGLFMLP